MKSKSVDCKSEVKIFLELFSGPPLPLVLEICFFDEYLLIINKY